MGFPFHLEATREIKEVGAGIQILPNSSRVLQHWGLEKALNAGPHDGSPDTKFPGSHSPTRVSPRTKWDFPSIQENCRQ
jgi:2-polyprenyl-6-methoxyphenol hydroxylase-like FAD-dependent oxidoreductase